MTTDSLSLALERWIFFSPPLESGLAQGLLYL